MNAAASKFAGNVSEIAVARDEDDSVRFEFDGEFHDFGSHHDIDIGFIGLLGSGAIMRKYDLPFEDRDIINNPAQRQEMIEKSGQMLSPCVEVNGRMLADVSGEEVEAFLLSNKLVQANDSQPDAPTNQACATHEPESSWIPFRR